MYLDGVCVACLLCVVCCPLNSRVVCGLWFVRAAQPVFFVFVVVVCCVLVCCCLFVCFVMRCVLVFDWPCVVDCVLCRVVFFCVTCCFLRK